MTSAQLLQKARSAASRGDAFKAYIYLQDAKALGTVTERQMNNVVRQLPIVRK